MKANLSIIALILLLISCSSDDGSSSPVENTPTPVESFGNWSPSFSSQTANFTQSRTGTQGTEQTRTIAVTITTSTITTTEEVLNEDVNQDDDLFDEVETITTTYTASESLGSFETTEYEILIDNNNGVKIGNQTYPLNNGLVYYYGSPADCENIYSYGINLYSEGVSYNSNTQNWSGKGSKIFLYFALESEQLYDDISLSNPLTAFNELLETDAQSTVDIYKLVNEDEGVIQTLDDLSTCEYLEKIELNMISGYYFPNYDADNYIEDEQLFDLHFNNNNINLTINKNEDGVFILQLKNSISNGGLPISLYFNGFLELVEISSYY